MKRILRFCWLALAGPLALPSDLVAAPTNNLVTRWMESAGPVPELIVPATKRAWEKQRRAIRAQLWQTLGHLPPRPKKPEVRIVSREQRPGFTLEKFQFDNGAGETVPGYLLLPTGRRGKLPAILYCHWHGGQYDIGKEELFRTNATPVPAGPALAREGYVVLAIDACCFGERNGQGPGGPTEKGGPGEMTASKFNLWAGRSLWGMMLRDDLMALDYLCTRPEVDRERIGVTGISMGSTRTWWLLALDDRLRCGVGVCCLTRYQNLIVERGLKYHGIYYFVPGLLRHFDTEAVVALAAPRPLLFLSGEDDAGSPAAGIRYIESKVQSVYLLYGAERDFQSILYPGVGHAYTRDMWEKNLAWLARALNNQ